MARVNGRCKREASCEEHVPAMADLQVNGCSFSELSVLFRQYLRAKYLIVLCKNTENSCVQVLLSARQVCSATCQCCRILREQKAGMGRKTQSALKEKCHGLPLSWLA